MLGKKQINYLLVVFSTLLYFYLFYFLPRNDSSLLIGTYSLLFLAYLIIVYNGVNFDLRWLIAIALCLRVIPIFSIPALSDDVYRFIWDGRLWAAGINPFAGIPSEYLNIPQLVKQGLTDDLYNLLNSPTHYTIYPPVAQYINWLAAKLFTNNITASIYLIRTIIIIAEIISIYLMAILLKRHSLKPHLLAIYALNPLVIIELAGNLHHEAFMITFLLGFLVYSSQNKPAGGAIMLALSVSSKLLPLMFLPIILFKEKLRWKFLIIFMVSLLLLFAPLLDASFFIGMQDSLTLYYQKFEFNAGIYYLLREFGYWIYGYNAIALIGKLLLGTTTFIILLLSLRLSRQNFNHPAAFSLLYLVFALGSLILHPWYVILFIAMAPFTNFKFPIVWSYLIFLTYIGYSQDGFTENYYVVGLEFLILVVALVYDWFKSARSSLNLKEAP